MALITHEQLRSMAIESYKEDLQKLIDKFMKQEDVISGKAFQIGNDIPIGWYDAISTTGFCVKVSEVFLNRILKNYIMQDCGHKYNPYADAKLICIELDSNRFGYCSDLTNNAWHTAIELNNYPIVIDLTCSQFGSQYNNKCIWNKQEWLNEFETKHTKIIESLFTPLTKRLNEAKAIFKTSQDENFDSKYLKMYVDGEYVGYIQMEEIWYDENDDFYFDFTTEDKIEKYLSPDGAYLTLALIKIFPEYRGNGYAKMLMDRCFSWFIKKGYGNDYDYVILNASPNDAGTTGLSFNELFEFYKKYGFTSIHRNARNAIMVKKL